MQHAIWKTYVSLYAVLCLPMNLWATRGSDDYGIIMTVMFMVYTFPVGLLIVSFIIYSIMNLQSINKPKVKKGNIVFIISIILIAPTVIIPVSWMYKSGWHPLMIEVMSADFIPILLLSIISAVLARIVKKRSI